MTPVLPHGLALVYQAVLLATGLVGLGAFTYIALLLARLAKLGATMPEYVAGFLLLALSHAWAPLMLLSEPRLAYTAYTATASFAAAGFLLLALPRERRQLYSLLLIVLPAGFDILAAVSAITASTRFGGEAKTLVGLIGAAFALRAIGVLATTQPPGAAILVTAELLRATTASLLAASYAATTRQG